MRRVGLGGAAAALIVGLGAAVATTRGADNDGNTPAAKGLLSGLFHEKPKAKAKQEDKAVEEKPQPASSVESAAAQQQRYMHAWFRRVEVCDRLRMIADQTGNEALRDQANELEDRANAIYRQQTSGLPLAAQAAPSALELHNQSRDREGAAAISSKSLSAGRSPDNSRSKAMRSGQSLGGSMDQREQAILNGSSMGGD
jgi:hypothetical protein